MRKLTLQMQLSLDGYCAGPNGELDWMIWNFDEELKNHLNHMTLPVDCIVLGRNLAEGFIPTWEERRNNPAGEDVAFVEKMNNTPKVVFSKTLDKSKWSNTVICQEEMAVGINKLKNQNGGEIIVYGGNTLVSGIITENLIDEYNLYIHPVAIHKGLAPFAILKKLKLVQSKSFACGIAWLQYQPQ